MENLLKYSTIAFAVITLLFANSCKKEDTDTQKPVINNDFANAFPVNCDTVYFDESFTVRLLFSDNKELGSYSVSIHNNFDHHSHSTEVADCQLDPVKVPVNPYTFIQDYEIPEGLTEYETDIVLTIPNQDYDEGDYHFFVSLTDREGWSTQLGLSVKLLYNNK